MKRILTKLFGTKKSAPRRPAAPQARPGIEYLEGRELPSGFLSGIGKAIASALHTAAQMQQHHITGVQTVTSLSQLLQMPPHR